MKKPLIINLRGNSGSGKTFTTRAFMEKGTFHEDWYFPDETPEDEALLGGKAKGYLRGYVGAWQKKPFAILGRYNNVCGGCDTIKTQEQIIWRVEDYVKSGYNIWLEGLILSTIYGSVGEYSEKFGDRWVFAYLQPPIEECIRRIQARRRAAGNLKPLNEDNTRKRVATIERNKQIVLGHGRRVVELDWRDPLPALLKIIRREGRFTYDRARATSEC